MPFTWNKTSDSVGNELLYAALFCKAWWKTTDQRFTVVCMHTDPGVEVNSTAHCKVCCIFETNLKFEKKYLICFPLHSRINFYRLGCEIVESLLLVESMIILFFLGMTLYTLSIVVKKNQCMKSVICLNVNWFLYCDKNVLLISTKT